MSTISVGSHEMARGMTAVACGERVHGADNDYVDMPLRFTDTNVSFLCSRVIFERFGFAELFQRLMECVRFHYCRRQYHRRPRHRSQREFFLVCLHY